MLRFITLIMALITVLIVNAKTFSYRFNSTPLSNAIRTIAADHPDININFIYNELENYITSSIVDSDNPYDALRQSIGLNPVTVVKSKNTFYVEALQHGKFSYTGKVIGKDKEPVEAATILLLEPKDSVVLTYGFTGKKGYFNIPCDKSGVIIKITSLGYKPYYKKCNEFSLGTIFMDESPIVLNNVNVEGDNAFLYSDRSVYIPTLRQKNSSQTGIELLQRMAIPQLLINSGKEVQTLSGKEVEIYINYVPATSQDLTGMRMSDVKKVEYYDYSVDPRFQGNPHVINFIMTQYEYGGYLKTYAVENFILNSGELVGFLKFQYKKMTYDLSVGGYYSNYSHLGWEEHERFRLPQENGEIKEFERFSSLKSSKQKENLYWITFRASYKKENLIFSNIISGNFSKTPQKSQIGEVTYTPTEFVEEPYSKTDRNKVNTMVYNGNWNFIFDDKNILNISPYYSYSYTNKYSDYNISGSSPFINEAVDNSNQGKITLNYSHLFSRQSTLKVIFPAYMTSNITHYSGTANYKGDAKSYRVYPGISYGYNSNNYYIYAGLGYAWDKTVYNGIKKTTTHPWIDFSFRYIFNGKNALDLEFHFTKSNPSASYRSDVVIKSNPLMSYTGNPYLIPYNSFDPSLFYSFIPNNKFQFALYGNAWIVSNRYVYDYEASPTGILRTIKQPMGNFMHSNFGFQANANLLNGNLQFTAQLQEHIAYNGDPYNWTKSSLGFSIQANYYLKDFYFGGYFYSKRGYDDGCMVGTWYKNKSFYHLQAGWANEDWNVRILLRNFANFRWEGDSTVMNSKWYDVTRQSYDSSYHFWFKISATYTIGFGKKIKRGDEVKKQTGVSSGILQ